MGNKKRHSKAPMWVTATEMKNEWCGFKGKAMNPISRLPFNCCSISLQPYENPVCSPDGDMFET